MKNRYYILGCLATLVGVMTGLYGCMDEWEGMRNTPARPSDVVCFTASLAESRAASVSRSASGHLAIEQEEWLVGTEAEQGVSRGAPLTLLSGSAGVIGYGDDDIWSDNAEYVFDGDELTAKSTDVRWTTIADNEKVSCHVYAPYNSTISNSTISYQVASTIADQQDLIVASWTGTKGTDYGTYKDDKGETVTIQPRTIPLTFEHTLTAVKFKVGFACTVTKLEVKGIYNSGTYTFGEGWTVTTSGDNTTSDYTFTFGENGAGTSLAVNASLTDGENTLMMIPQTLGENAKVILTYKEDSEEKTITATLTDKVWEAGKMITYTIHKDEAPTTIYFDLAAGDVSIGSTYFGKVYVDGQARDVTGNHVSTNRYYVYQSSTDERYKAQKTGYASESDFINKINCRIPDYAPVECNNQKWSDFITNNDSVESVIEAWYVGMSNTAENKRADLKGRTGTGFRITVSPVADTSFDLVIDDIYSTYQVQSQSRTTGGISFSPETTQNCVLTITTKGDNRLGNIHYYNKPNNFVQSDNTAKKIEEKGIEEYIRSQNTDNGSQIRFEGTGSLTVADVDDSKKACSDGLYSGTGYYSNHYCAAIGGNDDATHEHCMGIVINSGVLFAGSTASENCSAIGGGGNGFGEVTINGGTVTAVASTTGTAIGGGIGFSSYGGEGRVYINGGNVYAYNKDNYRNIPSSAIGGAGSNASTGTLGVVEITGGYVYAYSALGTAIGGGSSRQKVGGDAKVTITGGQVIAVSGKGAGIGGGSAYTKGGPTGSKFNGGTAIIDISGNPIIRTGSIGGGSTGDTNGKIGSAQITIGEGDSDIQAQFVMAAGAKETPTFTMNGGTIRNSYVDDEEYIHIQKKGGAVYLEDGTFEMTGGTIKNCSAVQGGAVYIARKSTESMAEDEFNFKMEGGEIHSCFATGGVIDGENDGKPYLGHGGAVCLMGGQVNMTDGMIWNNYSENGDGGAIYISNGNFSMKEGSPTITGNSAQKGNGGGVFVSSEEGNPVRVDLLQGIITGNTANNYGGGVCVDMGDTQNEATVTVGAEGQGVTEQDANPKITSNMAMMSGGGLYVRGERAGITIHSGMIDGNDVSAYVKNENVANHLGEVSLIDGLVTHVVVTFDGNGGTLDGAATDTQKIVKDTNSKLEANRFVLGGHDFIGWNTRKDGKGTPYSDRGFIVASEPVTLYAQWKSQTSN